MDVIGINRRIILPLLEKQRLFYTSANLWTDQLKPKNVYISHMDLSAQSLTLYNPTENVNFMKLYYGIRHNEILLY